jgi:hypothetical protein
MSGKFSKFVGGVMVLTLMGMGLLFMAFLLEEVNRGFEYVLLGLSALLGFGWLMLRGPVGKALANLLEGHSSEDPMIAARLADLEDRLNEISLETQRFGEIEERIDFTERLLARQDERELPSGNR